MVKVDVGERLIHREKLAHHFSGAVGRPAVRKQKLISVLPFAGKEWIRLKGMSTFSEGLLSGLAVHPFEDIVEDRLIRSSEGRISVAVSLNELASAGQGTFEPAAA